MKIYMSAVFANNNATLLNLLNKVQDGSDKVAIAIAIRHIANLEFKLSEIQPSLVSSLRCATVSDLKQQVLGIEEVVFNGEDSYVEFKTLEQNNAPELAPVEEPVKSNTTKKGKKNGNDTRSKGEEEVSEVVPTTSGDTEQ